MVAFFPVPYEDEVLYSVLARYHLYSLHKETKVTVNELFSAPKVTAMIDLPCNLDAIIKNIPPIWGYSSEKFAMENTLFPLFRFFWKDKRRIEILKLMKKNSGTRIHLKSGAYSSHLPAWKFLRFCNSCMKDDIEVYGEAYWHRIHQVPGALVCPKHREPIQNSSIRTYELNQQYYYPASAEYCIDRIRGKLYSDEVLGKLQILSQDIQLILNGKLCLNGDIDFAQRYLQLLKDKKLISKKGRINQKFLVEDFISYYGDEFLEAIGLMPNMENKHNWVSDIVRNSNLIENPIKHILMMRYLCGSLQEFLSFEIVLKPFGEGPFSCLNAASDHYLTNTIAEPVIEISRNKNIFGVFKCQCGFTYKIMLSKAKKIRDKKYDTIVEYGDIWEKRFKEFVEVRQMHFREIARILNVDLATVRKLTQKFQLKSPWTNLPEKINKSEQQESLKKCGSPNGIDEHLRQEYRNKWQDLCKKHFGISKSKLRNFDRHTFYWLNHYDKPWLQANSPKYIKSQNPNLRNDWAKRDLEILLRVRQEVKIILELKEKVLRISVDNIGKSIGLLFLLRNHLSKFPNTKAYLENVCESKEDFRLRKERWKEKNVHFL